MPIGKRLRFEVFKRDSFTCQYCGKKAPDVVLHCDHIQPRAGGGTDDLLNLITSCVDCNQGKSDKLLSDASVVEKQRAQLALLQERKEQIEMMMEWQSALSGLDDDAVDKLARLWCELAEWDDLTEFGRSEVRKLYLRHGFGSVAEAMRAASVSYFKYDDKGVLTEQSPKEAFFKVKAICGMKQAQIEKPWLKDLFYVRKIVENRCSYFRPWEARKILEAAYEACLNPAELKDALKEIALEARSWTHWKEEMSEYTDHLWELRSRQEQQWREMDDNPQGWSEEQIAEWDRLQAEQQEEQRQREAVREAQERAQEQERERLREEDRALRFPGTGDDD